MHLLNIRVSVNPTKQATDGKTVQVRLGRRVASPNEEHLVGLAADSDVAVVHCPLSQCDCRPLGWCVPIQVERDELEVSKP